MSPTTKCPACRAAVPVTADELLACPVCATVFSAPLVNLEPPPLPVRRARPEGLDEPIEVERPRAQPRRRRFKSQKKSLSPALRTGLILGGAGGFILIAVLVVFLLSRGTLWNSTDPVFDTIKVGMDEEEVLRILGPRNFDYRVHEYGVWTFPRRHTKEYDTDPNLQYETQDVIFVYFDPNRKVSGVYRATGREFRTPPPRRQFR